MRKIRNLVIGGIENKLFNLILATILLLAGGFMALTVYHTRMLSKLADETNSKQMEAMTAATTGLIDQVIDSNMDRITQLEAVISDDMFHNLGIRVTMLAEYAERLFSGEDIVSPAHYEGPDASRDGEVTAQLFLADGVEETQELKEKLGIAANMTDMMVSLYGASEMTNSCFIALTDGAFLITDDRPGVKFDKDGNVKSYDPRTRPWFIQAVKERGLIFTDVEVDAFSGDIGIVCAMPVYVNGKLVAVVGSDLFLTTMQEQITASDANGGFLFVINQNGHVVFSPKTEGMFKVNLWTEAEDLRKSSNTELGSLVSDALQKKTDVRRITVDDKRYYMVGAPLETVGWALIGAFNEEMAGAPAAQMKETYGQIQEEAVSAYQQNFGRARTMSQILLGVLVVLLGANAIILGKRIVRPLNKITKRIFELSESNLEFKMEEDFRTGDEIQTLAESFADISHKTVAYMDQIRRVTAEKERIGTELQMANQIQESVLPSIFPAFPERREFDIYASMDPAKEVGGDFYDFFLIDQDHLGMVMADVSGKGIPAALFMMASKIILQSVAMLGKSPAEVLTRTNEAVCSNNRMEMFVTVWFGILDLRTGIVTASNAGHEYPVVRRADHYEVMRDKHGVAIGVIDGAKYTEYTMQLEPGDRLFLYTDGLPEATNREDEMFGLERVIETLNTKREDNVMETLKDMSEAVDVFVGEAEQFDDLTMLCVEYKGVSEDECVNGDGSH